MAINRKKLVQKHNPVKTSTELYAPFTVGNGSIAFTVDVTGMQSLYEEQVQAGVPLLTMGDWGWHTAFPKSGKPYTLEQVAMTEYPYCGKTVHYAVEKKPGNEEIYDWVRQNPHRYNLIRIGLIYKGEYIDSNQLSDMYQELDMYTGILHSSFKLKGKQVKIQTVCHGEDDVLAFRIISEECASGNLQVKLEMPYGSSVISGADWNAEDKHTTDVLRKDTGLLYLSHRMDNDICFIRVSGESGIIYDRCAKHGFVCTGENQELSLTVELSKTEIHGYTEYSYEDCEKASGKYWQSFWEEGGMISFEGSTDVRAKELERRIILSLYSSAINSCTSMPPQETGLTVNSWYGKAHLEMHLWHSAYLPLWGRGELLKKSIGWYHKILPRAVENAERNGYKGARWPKMVGPEGIDCPSKIAMLLVWQQPHIIHMLELLYQAGESMDFLREHWELVKETAEFMADYAVYNETKQVYELIAPLIPAQEKHKPMDTLNPVFEVEYWRFGLQLAIKWAKRLCEAVPDKWQEVAEHMAKPAVADVVYLAHENCHDTYSAYAIDHPSMVAALGLLPGERIDKEIMRNTLDKIYANWNFQTMWGWDFAMLAMTETRLGNADKAIDILLIDTEKNKYLINGNNMQVTRKDLPLYLPGNGSLLLAVGLMASEFCFPQDKGWKVRIDGINRFPF